MVGANVNKVGVQHSRDVAKLESVPTPHEEAVGARGTFRMLDGIRVIDRHLRLGGVVTLEELAGAVESSKRTVQRYITYMKDSMQAPVVYDRDRGGYRYTDEAFNLPGVFLTEGEILALYAALPLMAHYQGTPLGPAFAKAFEKLVRLLPNRIRVDLQEVPQAVGFRGMSSVEDAGVFDTLLKATSRCRTVEITYYTAARDDTTIRLVDPYILQHVNGAWYLIGHCHLRDRVLSFHCGRVHQACITDRHFHRPPDFRADQYLKGAVGIYQDPDHPGVTQQVVLRFDEFASRFMRTTRWHPSQTLREVDGNRLEVTLELASLIELEHLILGWAEHVEVLEPRELKDSIGRHVRAMARICGV